MIIFFHGPDNFRLSRAVKEIKNKFIREIDPGENAITVIDGENMSLKEFIDKTSSNSLFTEKRLIIINNILKNKKESLFADILSKIEGLAEDKSVIAVFKEEKRNAKKWGQGASTTLKGAKKKVQDILLRQVYSQEFKKLTDSGLKMFIKKELESYGKEINVGAAQTLISYFGDDLWLLSTELKKLAFLNDKQIIGKEEVENTISEIFNENFFALTDAISSKNKQVLINTLEKQKKAGLSNEQILASLRNYFKNLLLIKLEAEKTSDSLKIANQLKLHPFVVKKGLLQSKNFTTISLKNYFNRLVEMDYLNKRGLSSLENQLFLLILEI